MITGPRPAVQYWLLGGNDRTATPMETEPLPGSRRDRQCKVLSSHSSLARTPAPSNRTRSARHDVPELSWYPTMVGLASPQDIY
jgi:hypothetical protein